MPRWLSLLAVLVATPAFAQLPPDKALLTMKPGDGLQVQLFAAEPMLINPTAMDVDHKGRVWITEAVNYRRKNFNRPILRPEGDRIQVLIDETGEGKATKAVTFYQGTDLYGPLSLLVLPQPDGALRVLVAQSPDILEFWDRDDDLKADGPPTKFLTGFQGFDHDHGVHGLTVGPDGKLYFTVGDAGVKGLKSKDGKGREFTSNTTDVQKGTVWRCDLTGNNLELIAHNFRNNYEACVDSFGEIWLSDNDDDGNQQTRICFVMPGGNYGYGPRGPGQSHWHEEQPGIVHKTLRTGFGSPTGICFYEGNLLSKFTGDLLHCDAGPREVRAFHRKPKGAGYELDKTNMLTSSDNWFRPSDVTVAPDGSVFVCDWYDPGVGGHGMGDWTRGRVYRLTPSGHAGYKVPAAKVDTADDIVKSLASPNLTTRTVAFDALAGKTPADITFMIDAAGLGGDKILIGRTVWPFGNIRSTRVVRGPAENNARGNIVKRFKSDPQLRAAWVGWLSRSGSFGSLATAQPRGLRDQGYGGYENDPDPGVYREVLLSLRVHPAEGITRFLLPMAKKYDGQDHFFRAAVNIACGTDPKRRDAILADFEAHFPEWNDKVADLVWELRPKSMLPKLEKLMADPKLTAAQKARIVDILAVSDDLAAGKTMLALVTADQPAEVRLRAVENLRLFLPTKWADLKKTDAVRTTIHDLLTGKAPTLGLWLAAAAPDCCQFEDVEAVATNPKLHPEVRREAVVTCGKIRNTKLTKFLTTLTADKELGEVAVAALGNQIGNQGADATGTAALAALEGVVGGSGTADLKRAAVAALAGTRSGTGWLLKQKEANKLPTELVADTGRLLRNSPFQGERNKAMILFPAPGKLDPKKLPSPAVLATRKGDAANGSKLLAASLTGESQCLKCHTVRGQGGQIGPDLSMIGKKGSRENLFESLLNPSKAIADQYVSWKVDAEDGNSIVGLLVQETATTLTIRDANGKDHSFPSKGTEKKKQLTSIMPEGLVATLTEDELVDVVEYLATLNTPALTPDVWQVAGPFPATDDAALNAKYPADDAKFAGWTTIRPDAKGYIDLAARHGAKSPHSLSVLRVTVESPVAQEATLLLGTDDGCRVFVNSDKVFGHNRHDAATPGRDTVSVKLKAGANVILLKVNNGSDPHGAYFTILSGQELKLAK